MEASDACWSVGASKTRQDFYDTGCYWQFDWKYFLSIQQLPFKLPVISRDLFFFLQQVGKRVIRTQVLPIKESENANELQVYKALGL